jgi:hypothetical protein
MAYDQMLDAISILMSIAPSRKEHNPEGARAKMRDAISTLKGIARLRRSGRTQLQDEQRGELFAEKEWPFRTSGRNQLQVAAVWAAFAEIEGGIVEAAPERRNWRRDGTTGHWIPPEVHRLPPDGSIEQSAPAAERREK